MNQRTDASPSRATGRLSLWVWLGSAALVAVVAGLAWTQRVALLERVANGGTRAAPVAARPDPLTHVAALGRIEPRRGVVRVAGPPRPAVVIGKLEVEEGDRVTSGQVLALLQGIAVLEAELESRRAELASAEREFAREEQLFRRGAVSDAAFEPVRLRRDVARAHLKRAHAELELSTVRAPSDGQVLEIHTRAGERVAPAGILELGETSAMYAIAEVYEADIARVRVGQQARVSSPALARDLRGAVERIALKVARKDVLSTDPVADADARVVEVEIRLEEPELAAALTNLRVDVVIEP